LLFVFEYARFQYTTTASLQAPPKFFSPELTASRTECLSSRILRTG